MKHLNLCIDIDGTITEAYDWIPMVNTYFNTKITPEDVTVYEIHQVLGIDRSSYDLFYALYGETLHLEAKARKGVKEVLDNLYKNHQIHFVTAREERMKTVSLMWLSYYNIPMDSLTLLGSHNKVKTAKDLNCDIFIEDRYENAIQLSESGFQVLLIDCNYNKGPIPERVTRVNNWFEIENIIKNHTEKSFNDFRIA